MLEDDSACDGSRVGQSFHCAEHDQFARSMAASLGPQLGGVTWVVAVYLSIQLHTFDAYVVRLHNPPCDIFEGV